MAARTDYMERVNRAIDHVVSHLDQPLKLESVTSIACFSPFHFHRVFRSLVGETLNRFVNRLRLERALFMMSHGPKRPLTQIALACGFSSSSDFSRSFKQRCSIHPGAFDLEAFRAGNRDDLAAAVATAGNRFLLDRLPQGENPDGFEVEMRRLPPRSVAYLRVLDPYHGSVVVDATRRLDWLFRTWLPQSGYVPDEQPSFEAWIGRPFAHGFEHFELFVQLPVKRVSG